MDNHRSKFIILGCLAVSAVSIGYLLWSRAQKPRTPTSFPPPAAVAQQTNGNIVESPDGKLTLTMKEVKAKDANTYRFTVTNSQDGTQKEIYSTSLPLTDSLSIPLNTFSPDDKYVFLKQTGISGTVYFALTASGDPIAKDSQTIDFSSLFAAKYQNYKITDATGWGGMNLIVFNTDKATGGQGPSFWFDVPSHSIIQLSNRFN